METNHESLKRILNWTKSTDPLAHWRLRLSKRCVDAIYPVSTSQQSVDALCRLRRTGEYQTLLDDDVPVIATDYPQNKEQCIRVLDMYNYKKIATRATEKQSFDAPDTKSEQVIEQKIDQYCRTVALHMIQPKIEFSIDNFGVLVWRSTHRTMSHT